MYFNYFVDLFSSEILASFAINKFEVKQSIWLIDLIDWLIDRREGSGTKEENIRVMLHNNVTMYWPALFRCSFHHRHKRRYGRLFPHGSACLAWDSHYMFRNFLLSTSRRVLYAMTDNQQARQTLRVATFNVLAPCYNWLRYVSLGISQTSMSVVCVPKTRRNTRRFTKKYIM